MRSTINDVAKMAGVSNMSVSLAFKGSPKISGATRRRIFEVAEKLNYVPNQAARQLRTGKTVAIEAGIVQSILAASEYSEGVKGEDPSWSSNPDPGAAQYILSAAAGLKFYLGNTVYLTLRGTYGLSRAYNIYGYGAIPASGQLGIGFKLYNYRKSAFKL